MRKAVLAMCTILALAITGCGGSRPGTVSNIASPAKTGTDGSPAVTKMLPASTESPSTAPASKGGDESAAPTETPQAPSGPSVNGIAADYTVERTSFDGNTEDIKAFYPQIQGLPDEAKQEKINGLLKSAALVDAGHADESVYRALDLDYRVFWTSSNLLSVQFYGYYDQWETAHPINVVFSVNIDMKTGDEINLPDIIDANKDFTRLFRDKSQFVYGQSTIDPEEIREVYFDEDLLKISFSKDAAFCFTSTGIVFTVYTAHVIGDYAFFSLDFSDISEYVKATNQWEDIEPDFPPTDFQMIRDQCFKTDLNGFGSVWFVSGCDKSSDGKLESLKFYLLNDNGDAVYALPGYNGSESGYSGIRAVSFKDVNGDGAIDVIIIAALYNKSEIELDEAKVYLGSGKTFVLDSGLNSYLSENLKDKVTVADVLDAAKDYFKA